MSEDQEKYYRKDWMSDDQWGCYCFVSWNMGGFHHIHNEPKRCGKGIEISLPAHRWATFDFSGLTRLVVSAHDACLRVDIVNSGPGLLKFTVHPRVREGRMFERHPTMEDAIESHRKEASPWRT